MAGYRHLGTTQLTFHAGTGEYLRDGLVGVTGACQGEGVWVAMNKAPPGDRCGVGLRDLAVRLQARVAGRSNVAQTKKVLFLSTCCWAPAMLGPVFKLHLCMPA